VNELFLAALNRYPTANERAALVSSLQSAADKSRELQHLLWALINSRDFQYRH
jgi:hypothetical protein